MPGSQSASGRVDALRFVGIDANDVAHHVASRLPRIRSFRVRPFLSRAHFASGVVRRQNEAIRDRTRVRELPAFQAAVRILRWARRYARQVRVTLPNSCPFWPRHAKAPTRLAQGKTRRTRNRSARSPGPVERVAEVLPLFIRVLKPGRVLVSLVPAISALGAVARAAAERAERGHESGGKYRYEPERECETHAGSV